MDNETTKKQETGSYILDDISFNHHFRRTSKANKYQHINSKITFWTIELNKLEKFMSLYVFDIYPFHRFILSWFCKEVPGGCFCSVTKGLIIIPRGCFFSLQFLHSAIFFLQFSTSCFSSAVFLRYFRHGKLANCADTICLIGRLAGSSVEC